MLRSDFRKHFKKFFPLRGFFFQDARCAIEEVHHSSGIAWRIQEIRFDWIFYSDCIQYYKRGLFTSMHMCFEDEQQRLHGLHTLALQVQRYSTAYARWIKQALDRRSETWDIPYFLFRKIFLEKNLKTYLFFWYLLKPFTFTAWILHTLKISPDAHVYALYSNRNIGGRCFLYEQNNNNVMIM